MSEDNNGGNYSAQNPASDISALEQWFLQEIQSMVHGLGDCNHPLLESAELIKNIVRSQMTLLMVEAAEVAEQRNTPYIGIEDFIFLLRRDKMKLRRLLRYLDLKDKKDSSLRDMMEDSDVQDAGVKSFQSCKKRTRIAQDFLSLIDNTGELLALIGDTGIDEVKQARMIRADVQTKTMSQDQYQKFCQSRQATFSKKQKFKDWLMTGIVDLDLRPNSFAFDALTYFTYETIAQIVDLALLVKQDRRMRIGDPVRGVMSPTCIDLDEMNQNVTVNTSPSADVRRPSSLEFTISDAIQPSEIHEAIRRYGRTPGAFLTSSLTNNNPVHQRLLCC